MTYVDLIKYSKTSSPASAAVFPKTVQSMIYKYILPHNRGKTVPDDVWHG